MKSMTTRNIAQFKQDVFKTQSPSRDLIVRYFQAIAAEAKTKPVTERDDLATEISRPFVELKDAPDNDPELEYIVSQLIIGTLDRLLEPGIAMGEPADQVRDHQLKKRVWQEVIDRIEHLSLNSRS